MNRFGWMILAIGLAAVMRFAATSGDLALDEIWSLWFVNNTIRSFFEIFAVRHDNNHLLNTMVMYVIGPTWHGIIHRIPAALVSILSVWLAGRIAMRRGGFPACVIAWIIVGTSYLLILYGTEARGYAYLVFFAYLSWLFLQRTEASGRWTDAAVFAVSASLGFLAHLTFLYCYAGCCIWTLRKFQKTRSLTLLLAHVLPCSTAACLYLFFIRGIDIGGGPDANLVTALISTFSIVMGGPLTGIVSVIAAAIFLVAFGIGYYQLWREDPDTAACFLTMIVLAPTVVLLKTHHAEIYPRYFVVPVAFALLLISDSLAKCWRAGWMARICPIAFISVYVAGNCWWTVRLLDHGRGDYSQALTWMGKQVAVSPMTVCTDHPFRNRVVFEYYIKRLWPEGSPFKYVDLDDRAEQGTEWMIRHNFDGDEDYPDQIKDPFDNVYCLQRIYRHQSLTGWNWWIYRKCAPKS